MPGRKDAKNLYKIKRPGLCGPGLFEYILNQELFCCGISLLCATWFVTTGRAHFFHVAATGGNKSQHKQN